MAYYTYLLFDEKNLTTIENLKITDVGNDAIPRLIVNKTKLARADGVKITNKEYGARKIVVEGLIAAGSRNAYHTTRSELLSYLEPLEKQLIVFDGFNYTEYVATVSNTIISEAAGGFAKVSIEFVCSDPYGYVLGATTLLDAYSWTTSSDNMVLAETINSMYPAPFSLTVSVSGLTGGTETGTITFANEAGETIQITRTWVDDDQITIDTKIKECKVNGVFTDYVGNFMNLVKDETYFTASTDLTTISAQVTLTYKQRTL
jgi:predicted phage tail component-like protein